MNFHAEFFEIARAISSQGKRDYDAQAILALRSAVEPRGVQVDFVSGGMSRPVLLEVMCLNKGRPTHFGKYGVVDPDSSAMLAGDACHVLWFDGDETIESERDLFVVADLWQGGPHRDTYAPLYTLPGVFRFPSKRRRNLIANQTPEVVEQSVVQKPPKAPKAPRAPKPLPVKKPPTPVQEAETEADRLAKRFMKRRKRSVAARNKAGTLVVHKTIVKKSTKGKMKAVKLPRFSAPKRKGK